MLMSYARSHMLSASWRPPHLLHVHAVALAPLPPSNLDNGQDLTICDIVWVSPQSHSSLSVKPYFLRHALQWHWPVLKRFSSDHWRWWRSKPGSRIVGSATKLELTTIANCQSSNHRLVTSIVSGSLHCGLRDFKRSRGDGRRRRIKATNYDIPPVLAACL